MSRTLKTDPYWVKRFQSHREVHNHVKGYCNLPTSARTQGNSWDYDWRADCYFDCDWYDRIFRCSCELCSQREWHRREMRTHRYAARREINEGLADYHQG